MIVVPYSARKDHIMFERKKTFPSGGYLVAFLGGVVTGYGAGLLFAPQSGEKTRRRLMKQIEVAKDKVTGLVEDELKHVTKKVESIVA